MAIISRYFIVVFFLTMCITGANAQNNCKCAVCGVPCNSPVSAHTNPACPIYKNSQNNKSGGSSPAFQPSFEQQIMLNIFSNILKKAFHNNGNSNKPSLQQQVQEREKADRNQKQLSLLLTRQKRSYDSIAQAKHDLMMKAYKQLDGGGSLNFKGLDDDKSKTSVNFNCMITSFNGDVRVLKADGKTIELAQNQTINLGLGDWIATGSNSMVKLHYNFESGGEDLMLGQKSAMTIVADEFGSHLPKFMRGNYYVTNNKVSEKIAEYQEELISETNKLKGKLYRKFNFYTTTCALTVRGTEFTIRVDESENTEVNVKNGEVDLTGNLLRGTITLSKGEKGVAKVTGEIIGPLPVEEMTFENWDIN